jgi:hypothetical protein
MHNRDSINEEIYIPHRMGDSSVFDLGQLLPSLLFKENLDQLGPYI